MEFGLEKCAKALFKKGKVMCTTAVTTIGLHKYLQTTNDWMMELVRKHENSKNFTQSPKKVESI